MARSYFPNRVLAAEGIGYAGFTFRVVAPLTVNEEAVSVRAGFQVNRCAPNAFVSLVKTNWMLAPAGEISDELYACRRGRREGEGLMFAVVSFLHNRFLSLFSWPANCCSNSF